VDAIMVGVGTVIADDPKLTARPVGGSGRDPLRVVVDTHLRTPMSSRVLNHGSPADTLLVVGRQVEHEHRKIFEKPGVKVIDCPLAGEGIDLKALMGILGKLAVSSLLVEGGAGLMGALIRTGLIDKWLIFKAPKILGGDDGVPMAKGRGATRMDRCWGLQDIRVRRLGNDIMIEGYTAGEPKHV
jgi:diaminohydroxyphosphoribosylaminopyrimidine deaminase/5-amino-6-(5-phosphoribosylamino)uracil reductase